MINTLSHDDFTQNRETYWRRHLETWRESGHSQIQCCREQQLKIPTFRYWKARLERRNSSHPFLSVTIHPDIPSVSAPSPSGISLFYPETLANLIDLLRE